MDTESFYLLTTKYLSGESTLEETTRLSTYLEDEYYLDLFLKVNENWVQKEKKDPAHLYNINRGLTLLRQRMVKQGNKNARSLFKRYIAIAAVLISAVSITFIFSQLLERPEQLITVMTDRGKVKSLTLPDGSHIILNAGSKLSYPTSFVQQTREVYLTGEAFFKVKSDKAHPFIVHTGEYATKAVGTVFNIKAFPDEDRISIALIKGKVLISNNQHTLQNLVLLPMQMLSADKKTGQTSINNFNPQLITSWKNYELRFQEEPLKEVLNSLMRKYGIQIKYDENMFKNCKVTASFTNESITEVLEALKFALRFNYRIITGREGRQLIIINGSGC